MVVTIIVLLILSGVAINLTIGNLGIFTRAQNSVETYEVASRNEEDTIQNTVNLIDEYIIATSLISNGSWDGSVNTPKLVNGMTAIAWDSSNNEYIPKTNKEWYNYQNGKWANAITSDGSYWVWIPRFEYKITDTTGGDYTKAGKIEVRFIDTNIKKGADGYTTTDGITRSNDEFIIHPAFTDGSNSFDNGEWDSELAGFWISKYKMSQIDSNGTNIITSNGEIGNVWTK